MPTKTLAAALALAFGATAAPAQDDPPLHRAAELSGGARLLLAMRPAPPPDEMRLHCAAAHGQAALVRSLLAAGADPNAVDDNGATPLHWAAVQGHYAVARLLLEAGANPNAENNKGATPVHLAFEFKHYHIARLLLDLEARTP